MSAEFVNLEKPLMVEIIRKRLNPGKNMEIKYDKTGGTTLENDMAIFLKTGGAEFCDINLILDGQVIPAHKSILSARCTYFQAMFRSFMPPDNTVNVWREKWFTDFLYRKVFFLLISQIQIGDISPSLESFHSLLRYIYYGDKKMPPENSLYLFQASSFYGFTNNRLQAFCKHNLEHNIHFENVLQILEASDKMNIPEIKAYALRMIVHDFSQVRLILPSYFETNDRKNQIFGLTGRTIAKNENTPSKLIAGSDPGNGWNIGWDTIQPRLYSRQHS